VRRLHLCAFTAPIALRGEGKEGLKGEKQKGGGGEKKKKSRERHPYRISSTIPCLTRDYKRRGRNIRRKKARGKGKAIVTARYFDLYLGGENHLGEERKKEKGRTCEVGHLLFFFSL